MNHRKHLIALGVAAVLGGLVAGLWGMRQPERYSATTTVAVAPSEALTEDADVIDVVGALERGTVVETLAGLAASSSVTSSAAQSAGILPAEAGEYDVNAVRALGANLVDITVTGPDAQAVATLSTTAAQTAADQFSLLYRVYSVDVVTAAEAPTSSDRPSVLVLVVAGAAVAMLATAVVIAAGESRRRGRHLESVQGRTVPESLAS